MGEELAVEMLAVEMLAVEEFVGVVPGVAISALEPSAVE